MLFGIIHYNFAYIHCTGCTEKICINTFDIEPPAIRYFTKEELLQLDIEWGYFNPLYKRALTYFPKETSNE